MFEKLAPMFEIWTRLGSIRNRIYNAEVIIKELVTVIKAMEEHLSTKFDTIDHSLNNTLIAYFQSRDEKFNVLKDTVSKLIDAKTGEKV